VAAAHLDPRTSGRFTQEDPIGIAGGLNLYGFGGGDPVTYSDPYGLKADSTYDINGRAINGRGGTTDHYLRLNGTDYKLDRKIVPNEDGIPYRVWKHGAADRIAMSMANAERAWINGQAAVRSLPGGNLDFKSHGLLENPRQLFLMGGNAVHTDVVGNIAWGYYVRTKLEMTESTALGFAQLYSLGKDAPWDQWAIKRAYDLPLP
jgi:hypothetical protein